MRGLMFNYLLEYSRSQHDYGIVDAIIEASDLKIQDDSKENGTHFIIRKERVWILN